MIVPDRVIVPRGESEHVRQFLDNPNLKRFFWIGNGPRNDSEQVVARIIERTTHVEFFKIRVPQGIALDPRHPEEATVIAFVVNRIKWTASATSFTTRCPAGCLKSRSTRWSSPSLQKSIECNPSLLRRSPRSRSRARPSPFAPNPGGDDKSHGEQEVAPGKKAEPEKKIVVLVWVATPPAP